MTAARAPAAPGSSREWYRLAWVVDADKMKPRAVMAINVTGARTSGTRSLLPGSRTAEASLRVVVVRALACRMQGEG
jgi:hypothetical protein